MNDLAVLQELQSAHNGLKTIERDLTNFPPDMARLDESIKGAEKRVQEITKSIAQAKTQLETLEKQHQQAVKAEAYARKELKASSHKAQYTIAMRGLDEKERLLEAAARSMKDAETALKALEEEKEGLLLKQNEDKRQFDELHEIFLAEHENQVAGKDNLTKKITELTTKLDAATLNKFNRLMQTRAGRAVVPMEKGACTGCNTRLRTPLVYQLKADGSITCESCQRIVYLPA
jgi:predicted  nucleic acid-binding Zn-ribbon protein